MKKVKDVTSKTSTDVFYPPAKKIALFLTIRLLVVYELFDVFYGADVFSVCSERKWLNF